MGSVLLCWPAHAQFFAAKKPQLLPEHEAFQVTADVIGNNLHVYWSIANDYYMYRQQFAIEAANDAVELGAINFPQGVIEDDPEFGEVEVYFYNAELVAAVDRAGLSANKIDLIVKGQGCNKPVGVCYPPISRTLTVSVDSGDSQTKQTQNPVTAQPDNEKKSLARYMLTAFLAGILLSFTPCVLPMIPILAGVIARQHHPGKLRSGWLACCYVAGTVVTYLIAGWVAGAAGTQLQAHFQNPWVIGFICTLLVLLAGSLFGWFRIELPGSLQAKLTGSQPSSLPAATSSFMLGLISALVVGACVSPILIVTLGAAIAQADPVLGAAIMGSMALGMGLLLILFGFGAGWILPRSGPWMQQIQVVFGFMILGVAIYLASTLPQVPSLLLWAALLMVAGLYCWQLAAPIESPMINSSTKAVAIALMIWGGMALVGGATGGADILRPLDSLGSSTGSNRTPVLPFQKVTSVDEAKRLLAGAKAQNRPAMVDFYADWCLDCKRMQRTTYRQPEVAAALQNWQLIEIDVTDTSTVSEEVKRYFDVFGPPATLFIKADGEERIDLRQYGYIAEPEFLQLVRRSQVPE